MASHAPPQPGAPLQNQAPTFPVTRPDYTGEPGRTVGSRDRRNLAVGLTFLAPNILGFLTFTAIPLVFSMVLAFSNWDLKLHNMFKDEPIRFVGFSNFVRLFQQKDFWKFLYNTLFFMMGMPFSIAASLGAAILLSKDLRGGSKRVWIGLIAGAILVASTIMLVAAGAGGTGMILLFGGLTSGILIAGVLGGTTIYRTLFYVPHFTSGVATYILWKKLYSPTGPITTAISGPLTDLSIAINAVPAGLVQSFAWICILLALGTAIVGMRRIRLYWEEGDLGGTSAGLSLAFLLLPAFCAASWYGLFRESATPSMLPSLAALLLGGAGLGLAWHAFRAAVADKTFINKGFFGVGTGMMFAIALMVAQFVLIGFAAVFHELPTWAIIDPEHKLEGLKAPQWLQSVHWAKPSIMIMGFWGAIGSNTMLLYLAALTNVPVELYEAADIDGASRFQKFWNVTWPQLAPTTFFIVVMGVIGGLQGGFEMARVMTQGGPAGQTTTLSYFIYTEGFETGRLGFSSAVAWALFLMVLIVTIFNWRFGNKYVND